ncbi:uncharacterized protein LOC107024152 isoform X2 [Solanum pennellii]|uniref:Uncharacterized protein LOC107024152 isoform X2 n=1 Tax=Solanum pennellii TaxID=28526 RepID=A0ABM1VFG7_SOLPN|nr:uncharacterized protein LOC107024152 isoform X2 [Solanum pennellii]
MPAVSIDGFSIREYVAKVRSVDVVKCWPFDESTKEDHVKAMLPPITVKKFSWWLDVLESEDSDDVVPVRRIGTGRKVKCVKGKTRVQKKRSIVDIFAVAPQVERIDGDDDYYDDDEDEDEENDDNCAVVNEGKKEFSDRNVNAIRIRRSKRRSAMKKKKTIASKLKEVKKTMKKDRRFKQKKNVNSSCLDLLIRKKERFDKLKVPNSFSKPSCSQHRKKCEDMEDNSPTYAKKPQRKHIVSEKKPKGLTDSELLADDQKMMNPVCSNLKKRPKQFPVENSSDKILSGPNDANFCSNQQGHKNVISDDATERGEVLSLVEEKGTNKHILRTTESEVTVQPGSPKSDVFNQVSEGNDNLKLFGRGSGVASHSSQYFCNPGSQQMYNHQKNDQIVGSLINACGASERSHDKLRGSPPEVAGVCSVHSVKAYPQHSSAYENVNRKPVMLPESIEGNCSGHFMQYQPLPQIRHQELMCKICSFPEWKQRESMHGEKGIEKDYVRLPLNSQGELIDLNSNSKGKLTQLPSSRRIVGSSGGLAVNNVSHSNMDNLSDARGWDKRVPSTDQLKRSSADDSMEWSPTFPVPSRLGIYEYDAGRTNVELDPLKKNKESFTPFELDCSVSNMSNHRSKQNNQAKQLETSWSKQCGNSDDVSLVVTPSKMRLMGKEFTVDRRDFHAPQDKRIWTDKQIIAEKFSAETYNYNSVVTNHDQQNLTVHPVLGTMKGMVACSPSIQINQAIPRPQVCPPHFSHQIDSVQQNCLGAIKQSPFTLYNQKANFEEPFPGGYKSFTISPYGPVPTLMHHYSSQNGGSSSLDLNSSSCAINFPYSRPDSGRNFRSSWSQFSTESTPWFSDAKQKKLLMDFHELYSSSDRKHHYCSSITGDSRQTDPSLYLASERFCSFTQRPQHALENPVSLPSLANNAPMPLQIGSRVNTGSYKRNGDVTKIISTPCLRDLGDSRKSKKRPLSTSDNRTNVAEIPNFLFREDPYVVSAPLKSYSNFEGQYSCRKGIESGSVKGMSNSIESGQSGTTEARLGSFKDEDTLKFECTLGSGPIKLTAGAKHVLKPCLYNDQTNFSPTHSTIQFDASATVSTTRETEQSTKIYKF